ncbi:hypothetical protein MTR67_038091, partial [Solanum verrucosum]
MSVAGCSSQMKGWGCKDWSSVYHHSGPNVIYKALRMKKLNSFLCSIFFCAAGSPDSKGIAKHSLNCSVVQNLSWKLLMNSFNSWANAQFLNVDLPDYFFCPFLAFELDYSVVSVVGLDYPTILSTSLSSLFLVFIFVSTLQKEALPVLSNGLVYFVELSFFPFIHMIVDSFGSHLP